MTAIGTPAFLATTDVRAAGGKGAALHQLVGWGFDVPPFFVVSCDVFGACTADLALQGEPGACRDAIASLAHDAGVKQRLLAIIQQGLATLPKQPVAVRSSARDEDGVNASLAGQHDTFLHVLPEPEAVFEAVIKAWQSLYSERSHSYRRQKGLSNQGLAMAVVVQTLIPSERSWVGFSANVLNRNPHEMLISAAWGLGEGIVSGAVDAAEFVLDGANGTIKTVQHDGQDTMVVPAAPSGVATVPVPAEQHRAAVLSAEEASAIGALLRQAAKQMGVPVDVEGALYDNRLYVLQVRPITSPVSGRQLLWDNSNIVESYAGVTTPLTFSFAMRSYQIVYTLFGRMLGIPHHVGEERERTAQSYLGLIQGRVYYNLLTWYESLSLMPGFSFSRGAMEGMMGVQESFEYKRKPVASQWERWTKEFPHVVGMVVRILWYFATVDRLVARFDAHIARNLSERATEDYRGWESARLVDLLEHQINDVTRRWQAPIMTDTGAMICYAVLAKLCKRWISTDQSLQNDLLSGEGGIESTEPTRHLMQLAAQLQAHEGAREAVQHSPAAFFERLESDPTLVGVRETLNDWLIRYGDRCMNELKLEEPSLRENPGFVAVMLRNYVQMPELGKPNPIEASIRQSAQGRVDEALKGHPLRRWVFDKVLGWTRKHVRNRENLRFARTRMFGVARRIFLAIGEDWVRQGVLRDRQDIFYLTMDEIIAFVDGRSVTRNLQALSDLRRAEFEAFRASEPDERFVTFGLPHTLTRYVGKPAGGPANVADLGPDELAGTPCCPGTVVNVTRLIREPGDDLRLDGEILVTPRTDPGWVTLFPAVSGLLVEKGSILSHSAIVARELGLPTIVGVKGLCAKVNKGQRVKMDGATGRVIILEETT